MTPTATYKIFEKLKTSSAGLEGFIDAFPLMIWTANAKGKVDYLCNQFYDFTGQVKADPNLFDWARVLHPDDIDKTAEIWNESISMGIPFEVELRIKKHDGDYLWHLLKAAPLRDENRQMIKWICTTTNIHSQKMMEESLNHFFYIVSHDLFSPINNLKGLLGIIKDEERHAHSPYINYLNQSVNRLDKTVKEIAQMIAVEKKEADVTEVDFEKLLISLILEFEEEIDDKNWILLSNFKCESMIYNNSYLVSILKNLISNSIKYRLKEKKLFIEVSTERRGDFILLTFSDNGSGIDLGKFKDRLFKPFQRFNEDIKGTGLGLYLLKSMVEKNGGRIEVKSKLQEGTTFEIYLKEYKK